MSETFAVHKLRVDNAHPTPAPAWAILSPGSADDDPVVSFTTKFNDTGFLFRAYTMNQAGGFQWSVRHGRNTVVVEKTAAAMLLKFSHYWGALCERERIHLATHAFALDALGDAGAKAEISTDAGLLAISDTGGAALDPVFVPETLEYALSTQAGRLQLTALRNHDNQAVRWQFGNLHQNGPNSNFRLVRGENVILVRVTAEDTTTVRTYTVTATRTVGG